MRRALFRSAPASSDYRSEHLFTLKQALAGYSYYQQQIQEVDREIHRQMIVLPVAESAQPELPKRTKKRPYAPKHNEPTSFSLRTELYRVFGVDLTNVPGISAVTAQTILCEVGPDLSRFRTLRLSLRGLAFVQRNKSVEGKCCPRVRARYEAGSLLLFGWVLTLCIMPTTT